MTPTAKAVPFVKSIFHPSDFSKASELAFAPALAIALIRKTEVVILRESHGDLDEHPWSARVFALTRG